MKTSTAISLMKTSTAISLIALSIGVIGLTLWSLALSDNLRALEAIHAQEEVEVTTFPTAYITMPEWKPSEITVVTPSDESTTFMVILRDWEGDVVFKTRDFDSLTIDVEGYLEYLKQQSDNAVSELEGRPGK